MKKNDHIIGVCQGYTNEGHGVVKVDGYPLFVKGMMKGEEGELIVTLMKILQLMVVQFTGMVLEVI